MFDNKEKNTAFIKLIIPYACVLLVPILIWLISNAYIKHNNEKKWMLFFESNFENSVNAVETKLENAENLIYGISQNNSLDDFFSAEKPTFEEILKNRGILSSYQTQSDDIRSLYIYSNSSDMLITSNADYKKPEDFFKYSQPLIGYNAENWANEVRSGDWACGYSFQKAHKNNQKGYEEVFAYVRSVPIEYISKKEGLIGLHIDAKALLQGFDTLLEDGRGELYVFNTQNELIMSTGERFKDYAVASDDDFEKLSLKGEKFYKISCEGEKSQWHYVLFADGDYVLGDSSNVNSILIIVNILALILGLMLCVYFTYGRNKSYLQILNMLGIKDEFYPWKFKFNEFEIWKPHIGNLINENKKSRENEREISAIETYKALHMLLSGFQGSNEEACELAKSSGLDFQYQKFLVMAIEGPAIYNVEGINNKNLFLKQVLKGYIAENLYLYIENSKTTVVIINYDMDTEEMYLYLKEQIAKMNLEVFYKTGFDAIWGISEESLVLSEICDLYQEALDVVRYKKLTDSNDIILYRELPKEMVMYDYPIELENKFIQAISEGKEDEAFKIVNIIYENNFEKRTLSTEKIEELFGEISSTLNKIKLMKFKDENPIEYKMSDFTVKRFFEYVTDFVYSFCESVKLSDEKAYKEMFEEIIIYINENYFKSDLSLTTLKDQFGFSSVSYISRSFKSFANENFSSYLEKIRMEKACELLLQGEQVKDICEKVGYISDTVFRRAFKKRMGLSPTDFIKNKK